METDGLNTTQITEFLRITTKEEFDPKTVKNRLRLLYDEVGGRVDNRDFFAANNCDCTKPFEKLPNSLPPFKISSRIIRPVLLLISFLQIGASKNTDELAEALVENCLNQNK